MKVVIQRVSAAAVEVENSTIGEIKQGLLLLIGIEESDGQEDIDWLCRKTCNMRIFSDENGNMNLSVKDVGGDILVVSQFTLHASTKKGNRPSFIKSAKPEISKPLYEEFKKQVVYELAKPIYCGEFGADMKISLENDGPVTIVLDSKNKE